MRGPGPASPRTRIKLCEFETFSATYACCFIGVDMLGFHIFSDQDVEERVARFQDFFAAMPPFPDKVLLTDLEHGQLLEVLERLPVDALQLYRHVSGEQLEALRARNGRPCKALKVMSQQAHENQMSDEAFFERYGPLVDAILLDSAHFGGTGKTGDWDHCAALVRRSPLPVFLAGGLNAANVRQAIEAVRPFGVDVETGVSDHLPTGHRIKNTLKCRLFAEKVREADWRLGRGRGAPLPWSLLGDGTAPPR